MKPEQRYAEIEAKSNHLLDSTGGRYSVTGADVLAVTDSVPYLLRRVRRAERLLRKLGNGEWYYAENGLDIKITGVDAFLAGEGE